MSAPAMTGRALVQDAFLAAKAAGKASLVDLRDAATEEAARIETTQAALIDTGLRALPDEDQIAKLMRWDAIEKLIDLFIRHEDRARPFFRDLENRGRRG